MATWSIVFAVLGLAMILPIGGSVLGIFLGNRALDRIEKSGERGGQAAQAAVVFGWFGVVEGIIAVGAIAFLIIAAANR